MNCLSPWGEAEPGVSRTGERGILICDCWLFGLFLELLTIAKPKARGGAPLPARLAPLRDVSQGGDVVCIAVVFSF